VADVTIALAFLGGAVFVRVFAWPVLRRWWNDMPVQRLDEAEAEMWARWRRERVGER
jgi:hypothetical protein